MDPRRRRARGEPAARDRDRRGGRDLARPGTRHVPRGEGRDAGGSGSGAVRHRGRLRHWKRVIRKELGPIAGIMQRKLALKGSLPIVVRFVKSAEELVQAATRVPTTFLDES